MARPRDHFVDRTDANDLARRDRYPAVDLPTHELAGGFARAQELTSQIDGQHRVPLVERHVDQRSVALQPGIVDENVHRPKSPDGHAEQVLYFRFLCNIG